MKPAFTQGGVRAECGIACTSVRTLSRRPEEADEDLRKAACWKNCGESHRSEVGAWGVAAGYQAPRQHRRLKRAEPSPPPQLQSPQPLAPAPPAASPAEMEAAAAKVEPPPPAVHACGGRSVASPPAWAVRPRTLHDQLFDSPDASAASRSLVAPSSRLSGAAPSSCP